MKLSIKKLSAVGFMLLIAIIISLSAFSYYGLSKVGSNLTLVTQVDQPLSRQAMRVNSKIGSLTTALGYLMISPSKAGKEAVELKMATLDESFSELKSLLADAHVHVFSEATQHAQIIEEKLNGLNILLQKILELVDNPALNFPAQKLYDENMAQGAVEIGMLYADSLDVLSELEEEEELIAQTTFNFNKQYNQFRQLNNALLLYLSYHDEVYLSDIKMYRDELGREIPALIESIEDLDDEDVVDSLAEINTLYETYNKFISELITLHKRDDWRQDSYLVTTALGPQTNDLSTEIGYLITGLNNGAMARSEVAQETQSEVLKSIILIALLSVIFSIVVMCAVSFNLSRLSKALHYSFEVLSKGDFTRQISESRIKEINYLAKSFNNHSRSLNESLTEVQRVVSQVQEISGELKRSSRDTDSIISAQIEDGAIAQSNIIELTGFSEHVSQCSIQSSETAESTKKNANKGFNEITLLSNEMETLVDCIEQSEKEMESLVSQSNKIDAITSVISAISEKTNLLSLNAAIEAARAGDHGRGFAVVADEVRALSTSTFDETEKITSIIKSLVVGVKGSKESIQKNNQQVKTCAIKVSATLETFNSIMSDVSGIVSHSGNISEMAQQQCSNSAAAAEYIEKLVEGSRSSEESSLNVKLASTQLEAASQQLAKHMCKFTL